MKSHKRKNQGSRTSEVESSNFVFGVSPVIELLRSYPNRVERLLVSRGSDKNFEKAIKLARQEGLRFDRVDRREIESLLGERKNHQGIVAITSGAEYSSKEELIARLGELEDPICLVLDGIEDPRNLGAILRTAECAGVTAVFIPERRASGLTATVAKSSAGAVAHIGVSRGKNINHLIDELKEAGFWVVGTAGEAETAYTDWDWKSPTALVMGSEGTGMHRLTKEKCDALVKIEMYGKIESLNVSVAAGVILFEACRQRG